MAGPLLVDTDVMIDYLRGLGKAAALLEENADRLVLSAVVVAELYAGVRGQRERDVLDRLASAFRVIPVTRELARSAGLLRQQFGKSHGVGLADAMLAATVLAENADLATLNVKHYPMVKGLKAAYAKA